MFLLLLHLLTLCFLQMSGAQAICRLLNAFEKHWGIL